MIHFFILFVVITILYLYVSYKKKNLINIMFFPYVSQGVIMIFLYSLSMFLSRRFSLGAGDIIVLIYFYLSFLMLAFIEIYYKPKDKKLFTRQRTRTVNNKVVLVLALFVVAFFALNINTILLAISNPRMFYASTRIGGGLIYFVVIPVIELLYFIYISKINFYRNLSLIKASIATVLVLLVLYIFGQKGNMIIIAFLFLTTYFYKSRKSDRNTRTILFGIGFAIMMVFVFILYSIQQSIPINNVLYNMATYSDYLNNFNSLVENLDEFTYGKTFLEDEFIGYIPRALWNNKPTLYGSLKLGLNVPSLVEWTEALTGAPSFGPLGQSYADFGIVGIFFNLTINTIFALIAKKYEVRLNHRYNFYDHFLFLTFAGCSIFSITLTTFPIYQLIVIYILWSFSLSRKYCKKRSILYENINQRFDSIRA